MLTKPSDVRLSSFQRQLNLYGFRKVSVNEEIRGSYYHCSFQRGRTDLLPEIRRVKNTDKTNCAENANIDDEKELITLPSSDESCDNPDKVCPSDSILPTKFTPTQKSFKEHKISNYRMHLNNCAATETTMKSELNAYISNYAIQNYHSVTQQPLQHLQPFHIRNHQPQPSVYNFGPPARLNQSLPSHLINMNAPIQIPWPTLNCNMSGSFSNSWPAMTSNSKSTSDSAESTQHNTENEGASAYPFKRLCLEPTGQRLLYPTSSSTAASSTVEFQQVQKTASEEFSEFPSFRGGETDSQCSLDCLVEKNKLNA